MNHWSNRFVGIPFESLGRAATGCDCWGLACIIYREELGISLPDYLGAYTSVDERGEIAALIAGEETSPLWVPVAGPAVAFDVAVFKRGRLSSHIGVVIRHGVMIHMQAEDCAKVESYQAGTWGRRLSGHWRHVQMISGARR